MSQNTVIVLLCDEKYQQKVKRTIIDIRSRGEWTKDLVLLSVDFDLNQNFKDFYKVIEVKLPYLHFNIHDKLKNKPYEGSDGRETQKTTQWQKLNVFHPFFKKWDKVIFFDAGYRVFDKIKYFDDLDCSNSLLTPEDNPYKRLECVFSKTYIEDYNQFIQDFGTNHFDELYIMNCMFIYDTKILDLFDFNEFISYVDKYTIWLLNEMSYMNFYFIMKLNIWKMMPRIIKDENGNNKRLHDWCEHCVPGSTWRDFVGVKYPVTIDFDCN